MMDFTDHDHSIPNIYGVPATIGIQNRNWAWIDKPEADHSSLFARLEDVDKTNGFDPLKAQFRRAEIYKLALQRAVDYHNYEGHVNLALKNIPYYEMDIDYMINDAKMDIDNGK
jgi:hypothetical protein